MKTLQFNSSEVKDLVSVIIPIYNQGIYLKDSIGSILSQDYPLKEIIVVNDGSQDQIDTIVRQYKNIVYIHQENQGVSVARNNGLKHSKGEFIIFLDADDILLPGAITCQINKIKQHPDVAFVSGGHVHMDKNLSILKEVSSPVQNNFYEALLTGNYIGMHASVLYRRFIFEQLAFDPAFKTGEDYDLLLKIVYKFPVYNHTKPIAGYRLHGDNISRHPSKMLKNVLLALENQKPLLTTTEQKKAYKRGRFNWIYYYGHQMYEELMKNPALDKNMKKEFIFNFMKYCPNFYFKFIINKYFRHQNRF